MNDSSVEAMTPEEYERYKTAEKEHLKKLKELKTAVRVLERRKNIQASLEDLSRSSENALDAHKDAVDRLAMETAKQEARLQIALESSSDRTSDDALEELDDEMRRARARALVDELRTAVRSDDSEAHSPDRPRTPDSTPADRPSANPTQDREDPPDKTIGRM